MVTLEANSYDEVPMVVAEFLIREIMKEARINLKRDGHYVTGQLHKSSKGNIRIFPDKVRGSFDAPYSDYLEFGTDPHWMPIKPLLKWANKKFGKKKGENIAYAVQRKIAKYGTEPASYTRNAIDKVLKEYSGWYGNI